MTVAIVIIIKITTIHFIVQTLLRQPFNEQLDDRQDFWMKYFNRWKTKYYVKNTHHFTSLEPPATGAFLQDFAFLFGIVAALQRSLLDRDGCGCCCRGGRRVQSAATGRHRSASSICRRDRDCCSRSSSHDSDSYHSGRNRTDTAVRQWHYRRRRSPDGRSIRAQDIVPWTFDGQ